MGLDMHLTGKRYLSKFQQGEEDIQVAIQNLLPELKDMQGHFLGSKSVVQEICIDAGYWRKANQVHNWFVENVQNGQDDCGEYYVGRDKLTELRDLCQKILNDRTKVNELPTASGFFFGSVEYDEYYFNDLTDTVRIIDNALALPKSWGFYYSSSW